MAIIAALINLAIGLLINVAVALVQTMLTAAEEQRAGPNLKGEETSGSETPLSFIVGTYASAGHFKYHGSWGTAGGAPTAYYTKETEFSSLPISQFVGLFVDKEKMVFNNSAGLTDKGYPVSNKNDGSRDNMWVRFYDGSQTSADALLRAKFGYDATRPYLADMIGRGVAKCVITCRTQNEVFKGFPKVKMVMKGSRIYDPRKDTSVGGVGNHRFNDPATYEWSGNQILIAYNILRGIYYKDDLAVVSFFYGGKLDGWQLPFDAWTAAMNVADQDITLSGGGTEKRFWGGDEIFVNENYADVAQRFLTASNARICEIGGRFDIVCGEPRVAAFAITDEDFEVLNNAQTATLFPGINQTKNSITGTYMEPEEGWIKKQLPTYAPTEYLSEDDDIPRHSSVSLDSVISNTHGQRIVMTMLRDARRFKTHAGVLPPKFWEMTPLDTLAWTSEREGYSSKLFEITAMDDLANSFQATVMKEVDPSDFGAGASDEIDYNIVPMVTAPTPVQYIVSWSALASSIDDDNAARRVAVLVGWDADTDDIKNIQVQVRLKESQEVVFNQGDIDPKLGMVKLSSPAFLPAVEYQVRGKYIPISSRSTGWSGWLDVTMLDLGVGFLDFDQAVNDAREFVNEGRVNLLQELDDISVQVASQDLANFDDAQQIRRELVATNGNITASYNEAITVAVGPDSAIAQSITALEAEVGTNVTANTTAIQALSTQVSVIDDEVATSADAITALEGVVGYASGSATFRMQTGFTPDSGFTSKIGMQVTSNNGVDWSSAGFYIQATPTTSMMILDADKIIIRSETGSPVKFEGGTWEGEKILFNFNTGYARFGT